MQSSSVFFAYGSCSFKRISQFSDLVWFAVCVCVCVCVSAECGDMYHGRRRLPYL